MVSVVIMKLYLLMQNRNALLTDILFWGLYIFWFENIIKNNKNLIWSYAVLILVVLNPDMLTANSVDSDQLASSEANWSISTLFDIKNVNLY